MVCFPGKLEARKGWARSAGWRWCLFCDFRLESLIPVETGLGLGPKRMSVRGL